MTKIPSVEERVENLQVTSKLETNEQYLERVRKIMQQDRLALLTELRESGLLEEHKGFKGKMRKVDEYYVDGYNTLARDIKEFISNMDSV